MNELKLQCQITPMPEPLPLFNVQMTFWCYQTSGILSAKVLEQACFSAIATASASVSWTRGVPDNEGLSRHEEAINAVRLIANSVDVPVSADIEKGFGKTPSEVGETVRLVMEAGAVGINIEDGISDGQRPIQGVIQARIAAARSAAAGFPVWINARVDTYLLGKSGNAAFADTLARASIFEHGNFRCMKDAANFAKLNNAMKQ